MTEIPEDIMKRAAEALGQQWCAELGGTRGWIARRDAIAAALLAERKRCAEIARTWDDNPYVGTAIAEAIMEGGEA